jgi:mannose-1-phosphate guanylyltransferase/phosphomannomutase
MSKVIQQAVILAGGHGRRLEKSGISKPKILLNVEGKTLLENHISELEKNGFSHLIISLGVKSEIVVDFIKTIDTSLKINIVVDEVLSGTRNAILQTKNLLESRFLLIMGDIYHKNFIKNFISYSTSVENLDSEAIFSARWTNHPDDSDLVFIDEKDFIIELQSKNNSKREIAQNLSLSGSAILSKEIIKILDFKSHLSDYTDAIFSDENITKKYKAYVSSSLILDLGTLERFESINKVLANKKKRPAVFFDRDGTLIEHVHLISSEDQVKLVPAAQQVCDYFKSHDFYLVCISNMPQVSRNILTFKQAHVLSNKILKFFEINQTRFDAFYICPHHPSSGFIDEILEFKKVCDCRKPSPGLIVRALRDLDIDLSKSLVIGDSWRDVRLGNDLGLKTIMIKSQYSNELLAKPDYSYASMEELLVALKSNEIGDL